MSAIRKRLLSTDPESGRKVWFYDDPHTGKYWIEGEQDVSPMLADNKRAFNETDERAGWKGEWHLVARVPNIIWMQWMKQGRHKDHRWLKKWLNDPDNRAFRVRPGRV